jgi:hypothetical protein
MPYDVKAYHGRKLKSRAQPARFCPACDKLHLQDWYVNRLNNKGAQPGEPPAHDLVRGANEAIYRAPLMPSIDGPPFAPYPEGHPYIARPAPPFPCFRDLIPTGYVPQIVLKRGSSPWPIGRAAHRASEEPRPREPQIDALEADTGRFEDQVDRIDQLTGEAPSLAFDMALEMIAG